MGTVGAVKTELNMGDDKPIFPLILELAVSVGVLTISSSEPYLMPRGDFYSHYGVNEAVDLAAVSADVLHGRSAYRARN